MIEYLPWSNDVIDTAIMSLKNGIFTTLDIELGGACPYNCLYCETPYREKKTQVNFHKVRDFIASKQFKWIYICGIGEPTYAENQKYLIMLLEECKKHGVRCSIFTNLSNFPNFLLTYVEAGVLFLVFKYDSQDSNVLSRIYRPDDIKRHLKNIDKVFKAVKVDNNRTNIAASIVPTAYNIHEVENLVYNCINHGIFPLLAQLEYSGAAKAAYNDLALSNDKLAEIRDLIERNLGEKYELPFCPSVLSGFHISNDNYITIDKRTGLSCHWFWLDEPNVDTLCCLNDDSSIEDIALRIIKARKQKEANFYAIRDTLTSDVFGGCGGNKIDIFNRYTKVLAEVSS